MISHLKRLHGQCVLGIDLQTQKDTQMTLHFWVTIKSLFMEEVTYTG
jgi:hypothetical protein